MTVRESSAIRQSVGALVAFGLLNCGAPPEPAAPAPVADDVTVPEPVAVSTPARAASDASAPPSRPVGERVGPALASSIEDGYETHLLQRVKVARDATARAHLEDPSPAPLASIGDVETLVVAEAPSEQADAARAVVDTKAVRVLLWFDLSQLSSVITERSELSRTRGAARRGKIGVTAHPGLRVKRGDERGGRVQVEASFEFPSPDSGLVGAKGWVEKSKVGYVYQPAPPAQPTFPKGQVSHIKEATDVLERPGGPVLAKISQGGGGIFFPVTLLGARGQMREVYFGGAEIEVRGFVNQAVLEELEPEGERGWGRGYGSASLWQKWPKEQVRIPSGTCIYDAAGGEPIGVFKREHIENVVIPSEGSPDREYRLPFDAVGHIYASDVVPVTKGERQSTSKESVDLSAGAWTCPKRPQ